MAIGWLICPSCAEVTSLLYHWACFRLHCQNRDRVPGPRQCIHTYRRGEVLGQTAEQSVLRLPSHRLVPFPVYHAETRETGLQDPELVQRNRSSLLASFLRSVLIVWSTIFHLLGISGYGAAICGIGVSHHDGVHFRASRMSGSKSSALNCIGCSPR